MQHTFHHSSIQQTWCEKYKVSHTNRVDLGYGASNSPFTWPKIIYRNSIAFIFISASLGKSITHRAEPYIILGGLFLIYKVTKEIYECVELPDDEQKTIAKLTRFPCRKPSFRQLLSISIFLLILYSHFWYDQWTWACSFNYGSGHSCIDIYYDAFCRSCWRFLLVNILLCKCLEWLFYY